MASGTTVDRTVLYCTNDLTSQVCLRIRGIYLRFYARNSYYISQHVKKTRKSALREKVDRYDDEWTGDDDDDDNDGQVRRGGTAIAMRVQRRVEDKGWWITMRDEICIAYGVLMIYLV